MFSHWLTPVFLTFLLRMLLDNFDGVPASQSVMLKQDDEPIKLRKVANANLWLLTEDSER